MSAPIDDVLSRLSAHKLLENGGNRWRSCCPAHGGSNPSALSVGLGDDGRVLLRCWHGCSADQVAQALGLELADLFPPKPQTAGAGHTPIQRRRLLTAAQALDLLDSEVTLAIVCAADLSEGKALDADTHERLRLSAARLAMLHDEVRV